MDLAYGKCSINDNKDDCGNDANDKIRAGGNKDPMIIL